ncbi:DMT family transporter [Streptomyces sp. UNOB3_S3]|uniref:DMT family transporter n=1 Tax=Streptomyces sp. UNOB3_S3 TaxID=2871682 RepID=UPI001E36DF72|nr:DMT family transporter [Streptomyces sp. UNOB3_S3]MCC3779595.1 DMT family transporter [Streptomyces sp. UNOB3_S3]
MAATAILWGSAFPAIRVALDGYAPTAMAVLRLAAAVVLLLPFLFTGRISRLRRGDVLRMAGFGLTGMTAYQLLLYAGERHVEGGTAAMLVATSPVFATVLGMLVLRERPGAWGVGGLLIALTGAMVVAMSGGGGGGSHSGMVMIVLAAAAQATSFILQKPLLCRYSGMDCIFYGSLFGLVPLLFFAPQAASQMVAAGWQQNTAVLWLGLGCTVLAFCTWSRVLEAATASTSSLVLYAVPVAALALDAGLRGVLPTPLAALGGLIVLAGVGVAAVRRPSGRSRVVAGSAPREKASEAATEKAAEAAAADGPKAPATR